MTDLLMDSGLSKYTRKMVSQADKDVRAQCKNAGGYQRQRNPGTRMADRSEVDYVLITPDQRTKRINAQYKAHRPRHHIGEINDRYQINVNGDEEPHEFWNVAKIRSYRRE